MPVPPWDIHLFIAWSCPWSYSVLILGRYLICGQTHDGVVSRHIGMAKVCKVFEMLAQSVFNGFGGGNFYASITLGFNRYSYGNINTSPKHQEGKCCVD